MLVKNSVWVCGILVISLLALPATAADWVTSRAASPWPSAAAPARGPGPIAFNNQTIRQVLHLSAGGKRLRIRISNEYAATIAPYEGASYWSPEGDPAQPMPMAEGKPFGDHLHGNDAGHEAVGNSIDQKIFR